MPQTTIETKENEFEPSRAAIDLGTTVIWENTSDVNHAVRSVQFHDTAEEWHFRTQTLRPGGCVVYFFDQVGVYEYYCSIHGEEMCRAVLVGDTSLSELLPYE